MFKYIGTNKKVVEAVKLANQLNDNHAFFDGIKESKFDMSSASGSYIAREYVNFNQDINVKVYYPKWKWSKALGYFSPSHPLDINLNGYKLGRSIDSIVGTLVHEKVHMVDNMDTLHSYGHGSNDPSGKANTAPYWIGNFAKSIIGEVNFNNTENSTYRIPWWKRIVRWMF